jgi:general secretion pathway protein L
MSKRTIIYLHTTELQQASWIVFENGKVEQSAQRGHLSDIPLSVKENDITVIVPARDVVLTQATLPKLNHQRLMQALPFAIEEQLIDELDNLHFAIADTQVDGVIATAIVAKKKMDEWLALLSENSIKPTQLYSAVFTLPLTEKNWAISLEQDSCVIRKDKYAGFAAELANLSLLIELSVKESLEKPECIHVYNTLESSAAIDVPSAVINQVLLSEQEWLAKMTTWIDTQPAINLLQGAYRAERKSSETRKIWNLAGSLAIAWIAIAFFSNLISFFILHHEENRIDTAINVIYKKNFPDSSSIVAPRERMESKLSSLTESANKNYFLVLLAKIGNNLTKIPRLQLKNMDFRDNQLNLEVTAAKFDDLDTLVKSLTQEGLNVKQQNAGISGTEVKATLSIKRGTS